MKLNNIIAEPIPAQTKKEAQAMKNTFEKLYRKANESGGYYEMYIDNPKEAICYMAVGTDPAQYNATYGINWNGTKVTSSLKEQPTTVELWIHSRRNLETMSNDFNSMVIAYDDISDYIRRVKLDETGTYEYHFVYVPKSTVSTIFPEIFPIDKKEESPNEEFVDFTKLYLEFEKKYNPYPVQMESCRRVYARL